MSLKQELKDSVSEAVKAKDELSLGVLRMALAAITSKEKEKRYAAAKNNPAITEDVLEKESALDDQELIAVLASEVKKRRDAIVLYEKGNRPELAQREEQEISILQKFLPAQLSPQAIETLVKKSIAATGATSIKDMGKVMADLSPSIKGKADGGQVSAIVKKLLSSSSVAQ